MKTADQIAVSGEILYGSLNTEEHGEPYLCIGLIREQIKTIPLGAKVTLTVESVPEPEPAPEPRTLYVVLSSKGNVLDYSFEPISEDVITPAQSVRCFVERPPGWKLVKEDEPKGRPLHEGVPQPPEGFDYWGVGRLKRIAADGENHDVIRLLARHWNMSGWEGTMSDGIYAIRRNTALHAANFGEVGR